MKASLLSELAICKYLTGELDEALKYHQKALEIDEELVDKQGMASDLENIGIILKNKGDYDEALKYLQKAYDIFKTINPSKSENIQELINEIKRLKQNKSYQES